MEAVGKFFSDIMNGAGAQPGQRPPDAPSIKPVAPGGFGAPTNNGFQNAAQTAKAATDTVKSLEHPAWGVIDKMAGDPNDRSSFAGANPVAMDFLKNIFS